MDISQNVESLKDWMRASASGFSELQQQIELGTREHDIRHHWHDHGYNIQQIEDMKQFIENQKNLHLPFLPKNESSFQIAFTSEQQDVINIFNQQLNFISDPTSEIPKRTVVVQGKAGSGKSTLIKYFVKILNQKYGMDSYALMAPTGASASNIHGTTIHSAFSISTDDELNRLYDEGEKRIQEKFRNCRFIIIDERSMMGCRLFKKIDKRCRTAKPEFQDLSFGGMFLYLFGDIKQLPPVFDRPLYSPRLEKEVYLMTGNYYLNKWINICF